MRIEQSTQDRVTVIAPVGRIDATNSATLDEAFRRSVDAGAHDLLVDLTGTEYVSSAGLRAFLSVAKRLRDLRGRLVLCGMGDSVRQVFQLAGFMPLFTVDPTREAGLARMGVASPAARRSTPS